MIKDTLETLRKLSSKNGIDYNTILKEISDRIKSMIIKRSGTGYLIDYVTQDEYISCRVANHLPKLSNYLNENLGRMHIKDNAHICVLFFGSKDANMLRGSEKGNYSMGDSRKRHRLKVDDKAFAYYNSDTKIEIPYNIYHFIPDFMSFEDISLISDSIETWYEMKGNKPFIIPNELSQNVFFKEKREKGTSSINCKMCILKSPHVNESINVDMIGGTKPVMTIRIGSVTIVSPDNEELTLYGTLKVNECNSRDLSLLQGIADFDFDAEIYNSDTNIESSFKPSKEKRRFDEQLKSVKEKHPELYESMMIEIEAILRKYLG